MTGFSGFDSSAYPGDEQIDWLKANTNLVWCVVYLSPAPSHEDASWMGKRTRLAAAGWGLVPIFVGRQIIPPGTLDPTADNGATDGAKAAELTASEGFAAGTSIYLDLENGPPFESPQTDYVQAWCAAAAAAGFQPGVYCSHLMADDVAALAPTAAIWAFKVATTAVHPVSGTEFSTSDPSGCGYAQAAIWQYDQNCQITAGSQILLVDLDVATRPDPGAP